MAAQPNVLELLPSRRGPRPRLEDGRNHRTLTEAAWEHGADWLLGLDADERLERDFRRRAEQEFDTRRRARGDRALWVHFRELWDPAGPLPRATASGARKRKACLYPLRSRDTSSTTAACTRTGPRCPIPPDDWRQADLRIWHLRMLEAADRPARAARYERIDPDHAIQTIGYDYLLDETGLELAAVPPGRDFDGLSRA